MTGRNIHITHIHFTDMYHKILDKSKARLYVRVFLTNECNFWVDSLCTMRLCHDVKHSIDQIYSHFEMVYILMVFRGF